MSVNKTVELNDIWFPHPETVPDKIDKMYKVKLEDGTETEDFFTGFNWYYYDYTEIVAWKPIQHNS